ncbi:DnaJ domain-containing protein [Fusobacterium sp. oral taxon C10]
MDSKYLESMEKLELQSGFTLEDLKKKWKELAKEYHPDKYAIQPERIKRLAENELKEINEAYDYLKKNFENTENRNSNNSKKRNSMRFYMSKNEALEYFSVYLVDLKKELERRFQPLATKIFEDYSEQLSGKFDYEPIFDEIMVLKDMTEEFFAKNLLKINAIKESDKIFLEKNIIKVNTLIKKVDNKIGESTFDLFFEKYGNKDFALLGAYRHYSFTEKIKEWIMEIYYCIDKHFKKIDKANSTIRYSRGFGETFFNVGIGSFQKFYSNNSLKENLKYLFNDYSNRVFKIFSELIYLGYTEDGVLTEVTKLENYRRAKTEPNFYLENFNILDESYIETFFHYFPNEKNNALLELYLALKNKRLNEIQNISTKISNIEYNKSFEIIVDRLFPKFKNKKKTFFINIQLLVNENSRKNIIFILKKVKENLEKDINYKFWGLYGENEDLKLLSNEYPFLNNIEFNNFIEESDEYLKDIFLYKKNLKNIDGVKRNLEDNTSKERNSKLLYIIIPIIIFLVLGGFFLYKQFGNKNDYQLQTLTEKTTSYSQPQQEEIKETVVENNNVNKYVPTVEEGQNIKYDTYYNDRFGFSIDYPIDNYFQFLLDSANGDGKSMSNSNGEIYISFSAMWNSMEESLQEAYNNAVREKPNATYKFLGKTFFTITYEENGLLIFRKTVYDKVNDKYVYLYISFPPEYKEYMTPIVERMANSMKK